jgi:hypothetical protein
VRDILGVEGGVFLSFRIFAVDGQLPGEAAVGGTSRGTPAQTDFSCAARGHQKAALQVWNREKFAAGERATSDPRSLGFAAGEFSAKLLQDESVTDSAVLSFDSWGSFVPVFHRALTL